MTAIARIPISNVYMDGDYTGEIRVGPEGKTMNVILDTGSSALALDGHKYTPDLAGGDTSTHLAQTDSYGDGSTWTGSVISTKVSVGEPGAAIDLAGGNVSIAYQQSANMFRKADGILGLAYAPLDDAFTMPLDTWAHKYTSTQVRTGMQATLEPYLTQLERADVASDKISFLTRRSFVHEGGGGAADPLNQGWMIVGGGVESTDLYTGAFQTVKVLSDAWYSTNLKSVIVGASDPIVARINGPQGMPTNSIVDSGTNSLNLGPEMLDAVLSKFSSPQQAFLTQSIMRGQLVSADALDLASWPELTFILQGETGDVRLTVPPSDYWQVDTQSVGAAMAAITQGDPGLSILGLPLMNPYFTIFDGEADGGKGAILFATRTV